MQISNFHLPLKSVIKTIQLSISNSRKNYWRTCLRSIVFFWLLTLNLNPIALSYRNRQLFYNADQLNGFCIMKTLILSKLKHPDKNLPAQSTNRNNRKSSDIISRLIITTSERRYWRFLLLLNLKTFFQCFYC